MKLRYVLEEEAGGTGSGGGGDAGAAAAAAAAAGGGDKGGGDKGSLLSQAGGADAAAAAAAAAKGADPLAWVQEKYRVYDGEGEAKRFNLEASAKKVAEAHVTLEKRMGDGGLPPEKPEGYKTDAVLASMKAKLGDKAPADMKLPESLVKEFNGWAHGAQLNQKQYDKALESYLGGIQTMVDTAFDNAMANAKTELTKVWGAAASDPKSPQMQAALRAFKTYAPPALRTDEVMDKIGNNPIVMQILAAVGAELGEDTRPHGEGTGGEDIGALMKTPAYWNKKHPEHDSTVKKVHAFFAAGGKTSKAA